MSSHPAAPTDTQPLSEHQHTNLIALDRGLHRHWQLGRNIVLGWSPTTRGIDLLVVPHYLTATFLHQHPQILNEDAPLVEPFAHPREESEAFIRSLLSGSRRLSAEKLADIATLMQATPVNVRLPFPVEDRPAVVAQIDDMIRRYSISYETGRAVILFDIVGFSLFGPLEQITQLNSLSYSLNSAHNRLLQMGIEVKFARSSTGDGFYVWSRQGGMQANINLYHFMHLTLADNAMARLRAKANTTPQLKTAFHIGDYYKIFQPEALHPTTYSYIVGDTTIELNRIITAAQPGQIVIGEFHTTLPDATQDHGEPRPLDTIGFIDTLQPTLERFHGMTLSGERIAAIKCYLTGDRTGPESFNVRRHRVTDKHGVTRNVYNAKINIHRESGDPVFLGLRESDLAAHHDT